MIKEEKQQKVKGKKEPAANGVDEAAAASSQETFEFALISSSSSPTDFIDQVMWQVNQLSFETLQPLDFDQLLSKDETANQENRFIIARKEECNKVTTADEKSQVSERDEGSHCVPIGLMSDVEGHFRAKLETLARDPSLN